MNDWWLEHFVPKTGMGPGTVPTVTDLLNAYLPVLIVSFIITLGTVPVFRWLAIRWGVIDRPDGLRKVHRIPIAYLGGAAVFCGVIAGILAAQLLWNLDADRVDGERLMSLYPSVTYAVVFGMLAIFITGVLDDVFHWDPRLKLAGQFVAAAGLAMTDFGTNAVSGLLTPFVNWSGLAEHLHPGVTLDQPVQIWNFVTAVELGPRSEFWPWLTLEGVYYWIGVLFIAAVVLGASNSANLIDGLDGLLSGTVGIMAVGFIAIGVMLAIVDARDSVEDRAVGLEIVELFASEPWADEQTVALLDFPTPTEVQPEDSELVVFETTRVDGTTIYHVRDGQVDFADLDVLLAESTADRDRLHAVPSPALLQRLELDPPASDRAWDLDFRGKERLIEAFDPADAAFNLVRVEAMWDLIRPERQDVIDRSDFAAWVDRARILEEPRDPLAGSRLVIALALLGACLGFIPYNFNPAVIFLGDAGSLLMGFLCGVLILSLGSEGQTHYVLAGLIVFALPIMDTILAILRRKLAGLPMSAPDKNHIHHMVLRSLGSVKKAVLVLYALDTAFVLMGVGLAATVAIGGARYLLVYGVAILVFGMVGTVATKAALRQRWMQQLIEKHGSDETGPAGGS